MKEKSPVYTQTRWRSLSNDTRETYMMVKWDLGQLLNAARVTGAHQWLFKIKQTKKDLDK